MPPKELDLCCIKRLIEALFYSTTETIGPFYYLWTTKIGSFWAPEGSNL